MAEKWEDLQVNGVTMRAFVCTPDGAAPHPAMVVIQHAGGVDNFIQDMTRRSAEAGYTSIAPDLYHREDPNSTDDGMTKLGRLRDTNIVADVNAALAYIRANGVANGSIGIIGFCMGGRVAFQMAGQNPDDFKASVPFYGGNTMNRWGNDAGPTPFDLLKNIKCPVLGFFGEDDANPSPEDMLKIAAELTANSIPHEFHMYSQTGHAYMDHTNPNRYAENSALASWPITLDFLQKTLGRVAAGTR